MIALSDPAVLYGGLVGFGHFVVIIGLEGDKIWYHDPDLKGDMMSYVSDFMKAWEKILSGDVRKETAEVISCHERTGRPLGSETFINGLEMQLNRPLRKGKHGPKKTD